LECWIEGRKFTLNKIFVMAWTIKWYRVFLVFLMHSSYHSFFNTFNFHSIKRVRPTIFTLHTRCTNLDITCALLLPCVPTKKKHENLMDYFCVTTKNIKGVSNCTHTLIPSTMAWKTPWLSMFASSTQLVTKTNLDLFFTCISLMYGYQA
jgi:hypothetical protein